MTTATTTGRAAAEELAALLPTAVPLHVADFDPATGARRVELPPCARTLSGPRAPT